MTMCVGKRIMVTDIIRKAILAWLFASLIEMIFGIGSIALDGVEWVSEMSFVRFAAIFSIVFAGLFVCFFAKDGVYGLILRAERWAIAIILTGYCAISLSITYTTPFLVTCILLCAAAFIYAFFGCNLRTDPVFERETGIERRRSKAWLIAAVAAAAVFAFLSIWTVCRVRNFHSSSYDMGIFSQMFYRMKTSGLMNTTLERSRELSHLAVHFSPIWYILLPIYLVFPYPETLQVVQAALVASAAIPFYLICRRHFSSPFACAGLAVILLLFPAIGGGVNYDIHENAFLAPLVLWLVWSFESDRKALTVVFALLTLFVKEDSAVYVAIVSLYFVCAAIIRGENGAESKKAVMFSAGIFLISICWFFLATGFLKIYGEGVMTVRYKNFIPQGSGSLLDVIKTVMLCPAKVVFECIDREKLEFIFATLLPLGLLPLLTRKYERYFLLVPFVLLNLMSDNTYQHSIFFQYSFGSGVLLLYLTALNLKDIFELLELHAADGMGVKRKICRFIIIGLIPVIIGQTGALFGYYPFMKGLGSIKYHAKYCEELDKKRKTLLEIPEEASVAADPFFTTTLSQRVIIYDLDYASQEQILSCDYVVMNRAHMNKYRFIPEEERENAREHIDILLTGGRFELIEETDEGIVIYAKA